MRIKRSTRKCVFLRTVNRKARMGRNRETGESVKIAAKTRSKFSPGKGRISAEDEALGTLARVFSAL